jgi:hypothetical protein
VNAAKKFAAEIFHFKKSNPFSVEEKNSFAEYGFFFAEFLRSFLRGIFLSRKFFT